MTARTAMVTGWAQGMAKAVQKHMVDAGYGRIVNLSSTSALGNRGQTNYSTAKAGLQGFTKTLALGKLGITANCITPGVTAHVLYVAGGSKG